MADLRTALSEAIEQHRNDEPIAGDEKNEPKVELKEPITEKQAVEKLEAKVEKTEPKADKPRHEDGKFAPKEPKIEAKEEIKPEVPIEPKIEQEAKPKVPRPNSWRKEYWESFDKLDPQLASYINERESQIHTGIEQYREKAQLAQAWEQTLAPYQESFRAMGRPAMDAVKEILGFENVLRFGNNIQKIQMLQNLVNTYGITTVPPEQVQQQQLDPRTIEQIVQTKLVERDTTEQLNKFLANPPEYFDSVKHDMVKLLEANYASTYQEAYDKAVRLHPEIYDSIIAKQQQESVVKQQAEANKAAQVAKSKAVSVKGSSTGTKTTTSNGSDRRSSIADLVREAAANRV